VETGGPLLQKLWLNSIPTRKFLPSRYPLYNLKNNQKLVIFFFRILGVHTNLCMVSTPKAHLLTLLGSIYPSLLVEKDKQHLVYPWSKKFFDLIEESGYFHIQATKPDTIGR